ncbi:MAG: RrF2 family transcriptional regulator [Acidimicrobiales bacterium]
MVTNRSAGTLATAARALLVLVQAPRGMATSAEVANTIGSHPVVVRRILGSLRWTGFVESRSGPGGGWAIAKDPATIHLGEVYRAMFGIAEPAASALDELMTAAEATYVEHLSSVTLADLARQIPSRHDS